MLSKIKERWGIKSNFQLLKILIVFALTGSISAWISKPICFKLGVTKELFGLFYFLIYLLVILPIYKVLLLLIGTVFGEFNFFKSFLQKMFVRIGLGFLFK
jgi:hypothetical protein